MPKLCQCHNLTVILGYLMHIPYVYSYDERLIAPLLHVAETTLAPLLPLYPFCDLGNESCHDLQR